MIKQMTRSGMITNSDQLVTNRRVEVVIHTDGEDGWADHVVLNNGIIWRIDDCRVVDIANGRIVGPAGQEVTWSPSEAVAQEGQ